MLTNVLEDVDHEERSDKVIDALHVAAGWMADGPDEQDPLKYLKKNNKKKKWVQPNDAKLVKQKRCEFKNQVVQFFYSPLDCEP